MPQRIALPPARSHSISGWALGLALAVLLAVIPRAEGAAPTQGQIDAARNKGLAWLFTRQGGDGSWKTTLGTEFAATATALEALRNAGLRSYPYAAGVSWLSNASLTSVDSLARRIVALKGAGVNVIPDVQKLIGWRNSSLTWGAYDHFETSFPDTPLATAAIRTSQFGYSEYQSALCAMVAAQKPGTDPTVAGSWSYIWPGTTPPDSAIGSAVVPTAVNVLEINAIMVAQGLADTTCSGSLLTAINNGITWLMTQRRNATDGGFGELLSGMVVSTVLETALVYQVLKELRPTDPATDAALNYLITNQRSDFSWNGDALQTALVLKVLPPPLVPLVSTANDGIPDVVKVILGMDPNVPDRRWLARGINALISLSPSSATAGGAGFTLTITGGNFLATSTVRWNGANRVTTFGSPTLIQATIPASDLLSAGTAQVIVFTPSPGGGPSNPLPFTVFPTAPGPPPPTAALAVVKAGTGSGTVTSSPAGIACGMACGLSLATGTVVTLTASPDTGSTFAGWSGGGCTGAGTCTVTLTADTVVTATLTAPQFPLAVARDGTGSGTVTSSPAGIACGAACSAPFASGSPVTLTATPDAGSLFAGWSGDAGCATGVVTMTAALSCTATFTGNDIILGNRQPGTSFTGTWTVSPAPNPYSLNSLAGSGVGTTFRWTPTIPATGSYQVYVWWTSQASRSTTVPITVASAAAPQTFPVNQRVGGGQWQLLGTFPFNAGAAGSVEVSGANGEAAADAARWIPAGSPALAITKTGTGTGTVTSSPVGISCGAVCSAPFGSGSMVILSASPDAGSVFVGWSGDADCATGVLTMTVARACTATFTGNDIILDNGQPGTSFTGTWTVSPAPNPYGLNSLAGSGAGTTYRWTPTIPVTGSYQVYVWWTSQASRSATVPITVVFAGGQQTFTVNQRVGGGQWQLLGTFTFNAGTTGYVEVSGANGEAAAGAVRWLPQ